MQKLTRSLFALGVLAGLAACGDDVSVTEPPPVVPAVTGITVSPGAATLIKGGTAQLSAVVTANDPSVATTVTWSTSSATVATVSATGLVTAVGPGAATITATSTANANFKAGAQITVTGSGVRTVAVSPNNAIVATGATLQLVANVDADAGIARTVNWTSSNTAVATVSASGVVTGVSAGNVTITAASTVDATVTGAAAITVRNPLPATISISNITAGGLGAPVNINNVAGQIEVTLNVDPGDFVIQRVEVLIDNNIACTQSFTASRNEELALSHVFANVQAAPVTCSINTAAFDATTGALNACLGGPTIACNFNGTRLLSARAILTSGTSVATPSTSLVFNNASGFKLNVTTGSQATSTAGLLWTEGDIGMTVVPVIYVQGATVTTVTVDPDFSCGGALAAKSGLSLSWAKATTVGSGGSQEYQTAAAGCNPAVTGSVLSNGQPGPTLVLNGTLPLIPAILLRHDNLAPTGGTLVLTQQSATADCCSGNWFGTAYAFAAGHTATGGGVAPADAGVGIGATTYHFGATSLTAAALVATPAITTGSQVPETQTVTANTIGARSCDLLNNCTGDATQPASPIVTLTGAGLNPLTTAGSDQTAPGFTYAAGTVAADAIFNGFTGIAGPHTFTATPTDNLSSFGVNAEIVRLYGNFTTASSTQCFTAATTPVGWSGTFASGACPFALGGGTFSNALTIASPFARYFTDERNVRDQGGNKPATALTRSILADDIVPTVSNVAIPPSLVGGAAATFTAAAADGLDLGTAAASLEFPSHNAGNALPFSAPQTISTFGLPLVTTFSASATFNFVRSMEAATPAPAGGTPPAATGVRFLITDVAGNFAVQVNTFAVGTVPAGVSATTLNLATYQVATPSAATNVCRVATGCTVANTPTTVTITVTATGPVGNFANPFSAVHLFRNDGAANRLIGTATSAVSSATGAVITWTWTFTFDATGITAQANVPIFAVGVSAAGDGLYSQNNTNISIVP